MNQIYKPDQIVTKYGDTYISILETCIEAMEYQTYSKEELSKILISEYSFLNHIDSTEVINSIISDVINDQKVEYKGNNRFEKACYGLVDLKYCVHGIKKNSNNCDICEEEETDQA